MWNNLDQTRYIDMVPAYQTWVVLASLFVFTSSFYFNHEAWSWQLLFRKSRQKQYKHGVKMCIDPCTMYITREMFLDCGKLVVARFPDSLLCMMGFVLASAGMQANLGGFHSPQVLSTRNMMEWKAVDVQNIRFMKDILHHLRFIKTLKIIVDSPYQLVLPNFFHPSNGNFPHLRICESKAGLPWSWRLGP